MLSHIIPSYHTIYSISVQVIPLFTVRDHHLILNLNQSIISVPHTVISYMGDTVKRGDFTVW